MQDGIYAKFNTSKGEILVKIAHTPINPSDLAFLRGLYPTRKKLPVIPGIEASGTVVATGDDFFSRRLLGKNVACTAPADGNGTWAEYMLTSYKQAIPLKKYVNLEQGSMMFVNPFSVLAMVDIAKKGGHRAIANTAAASALGQMLNKICLQKNLVLVNVVRREEQEELLKSQGAKHVVNSSSRDFKEELSRTFIDLKVTLAFDAISGQMAFDLIEALPEGGEMKIYGALSEEPIIVNPGNLIFQRKNISGFWLSEWIVKQHFLKLISVSNEVQKYLGDGNGTSIHKRVTLAEAMSGIDLYVEKMTAGKILISPGKSEQD